MNKTAWLPGGIKKRQKHCLLLFVCFIQRRHGTCIMWEQPCVVHTYLHVRPVLPNEHWPYGQETTWGRVFREQCVEFAPWAFISKKKKKKKCVHGINQQDRTFLDSLPPECDRYLPHGRAHSNPLGLLTCAHQCSHVDQPLLIWNVQKKKKEKKETGGLILDGSQPSSCHAEQITPGKPFCLFAWSIKDEPAPVMKNPFNQEFISGKVEQWH